MKQLNIGKFTIFLVAGFMLSALGSVSTAIASEAGGQQPTSVLAIDSGPIQGLDDGELLSWEGIPYAAPPTGDNRWQPPQPVLPWTATYQATALGNQCIQNADLGAFATPGGSEDCLYLNVYAGKQAVQAAKSAGRKLPVLFWIHGGSLWVGQGGDYDPRKLAVQGEAIVITINYRLGMFGFFAHPDIDKEGHAVANYGQMDQSFALDWVQRNISAFGGDPDNVTIAGESSGGTSVIAQVVSPWSKGKFQHAIVMSGASMVINYPYFASSKPLDEAERIGVEFAKTTGCEINSAECLRNLTTGQILAAQTPYMINNTIIDGDFFPEPTGDAIRAGRFNKVTLVVGTTRDEGTFFAGFPENETGIPLTEEHYAGTLQAFFGKTLGEDVEKEYPLIDYTSPSEAYASAVTDYLFACPARVFSAWASDYTNVYAYEFADRTAPSYLKPTTFPLGAAHTYELSYLFPGFHGGKRGLPTELNSLQEGLSAEMVSYWTGIADASKWTAWPQYSAKKPNVLRLMLPASRVLELGHFGSEHHCGFWDKSGVY